MRILAFIIISFLAFEVQAQSTKDLSVELQVYPTGVIPGLRYESSLTEQSSLSFRLGYNIVRHRDLGVHDDERGGGFGGSIGYRKYFKPGFKGWSWSLKTDVWFNEIDWYDIGPLDDRIEGETSITVLQPTAELGYTFVNNSFSVTPTLSFGFEWNVRTVGEPTGQGSIILLGVQVGRRF